MAGGDLLFIFAFIVLPTAVLVSCIWALILLRKGVLLPERSPRSENASMPASRATLQATTDAEPIESTGEHTVVTAPAPVAEAGSDTEPAAPEPAPVSSGAAVEQAAVADDLPPAEQTQELEAVPLDDSAGAAPMPPAAQPEPVTPQEQSADRDPELVTEPDVPSAPEQESVASEPGNDFLIVPLDERPGQAAAGTGRSQAVSGNGAANSGEPVPPTSPQARRPARRAVGVRHAEPVETRPRPRVGQRRNPRRGGGS